ncbi:sugar ABC transporter permease [Spiroplasma endosymbiont of Crioceris asparagi]|uniref:carbohydrate ABC transporter permease n=1 Tax=Spiroplasma endosymbiont of Crioceris asparagi TaxID=3066286 RepID=UPI0030D1FD65
MKWTFVLRVDRNKSLKPDNKKHRNKNKNMQKGKFDLINQLIWITPALFLLFLFAYYSIYILFKRGFDQHGGYSKNFTFSWRYLKMVWNDADFIIGIKNSFIYVVIAIPISLLISLLIAKCLADIVNKKIFAFLQSLFFMPFVTTALAITMAFSAIFSSTDQSLLEQLLKKLGVGFVDFRKPVNAKMILIFYGIWKMMPFKIIMFTVALSAVDKKLYSAASIDGMAKWKQFWAISIPQIIPIIIYMITTSMIGAFKYMPLGLFGDYNAVMQSKAQTMVYYIFENMVQTQNYGKASAASIILMIIIGIMTIVNRFITKTLSKKYKSEAI